MLWKKEKEKVMKISLNLEIILGESLEIKKLQMT
jgi:hypothetical protein